jgi:drug/metabolite transporter (DMT)-like permease
MVVRRGQATRPRGREIAAAVLVGTLLCFLGNGLVTVAEQHVPSGLAALLVGSVPMWVVLLRTGAGERVLPGTLGGVAVGFGGLALLLLPGSRPHGAALGSALLVVFAAACWASGSFASTRLTLPRHALHSTGWQMLGGGLVMSVVGLVAGEGGDVDLSAFSGRSVAAFLYLVFIGSLVAFSAYAWLLQHAPISLVATYAYVNPVVAVFLGWLILDEQITVTTAVGAAVVVASVWWIVRARPVAPPREAATEARPVPETEARSVL